MKPSTRSEIKRIFGNRHTEEHPLKHSSAGMEWFARSLPLIRQLNKSEIDNFLVPLIDDLLAQLQNDCDPCTGKLLAFAELYCSHASVTQSQKYWLRYQKLMKDRSRSRAKFRDFKSETFQAIHLYSELGIRG